MTAASEQQIYERLNEISESLVELAAGCKICQPIVFGNGKSSLDHRVTRLEMIWKFVGGIAPVVSGVIVGLIVRFT